jgi:hypothetical protein
MKSKMYIIWSGAVAMLATLAYADATVRLSNVESLMPVYWREAGNLAAGDNFYIEVWGGPIGSADFLITPVGATTPIIKLHEPGFFNAGIGIIPQVFDNGQVTLRIRGWYGSPDYGYASAVGDSGQTYLWTQLAGSWDPNSGLAPSGPSLAMPWPLEIGFAIPEPTTMTLALLGGGLVLAWISTEKNLANIGSTGD